MPSRIGSQLPAFQAQNRALDLPVCSKSLRFTSPKGLYIAPSHGDPTHWQGVLFVRTGPYAPVILRFKLVFPASFPNRPPSIEFSTDIFHPLVTPLTTYTYTTNSSGTETVSATDDERLPPGGFSLRHGFEQWYGHRLDENDVPPHTVDVLYYIRSVFISEDLLDSIPLDAAANPGAWHAWQSYRSKTPAAKSTGAVGIQAEERESEIPNARQQPGGARMPGEWNWEGVWEERMKRSVRTATSEQAIYGGSSGNDDLINFSELEPDVIASLQNWK